MAAGHRLSYGSNSRQYVEIYPSENADKSRSCPLIIFIHGGGWYSGSTTDHEDLAKHISSESETAVALVTYRITNKDKPEENTVYHPDHINDVHAGLDLLFKSATSAEYRYDLKRVTLVGHSAGGWMVLSAALNSEANRNAGPVANMPPLKASIRKAIRSFVAVESIFSLVHLIRIYPSYDSFIIPAFFPPSVKARAPYRTLQKAGVEAWPLASTSSYHGDQQPKLYIIHSSEDDLLNAEYNAMGIELLKAKGLDLTVDTTSFKGKHDDLLHTEAFWKRLVDIAQLMS